jgi:vacuolar-type H+-ATPase subunit H
MGSDGPARRREIEDSTAARLAEIVAAAERAAKQVIDQAEEEARERISDAHEEAERIVAARLAGLGDLTDEIGAQAEGLVRQAEALQGALARAKAEMGGAEALGGSATMARRESEPEPEPEIQRPAGPSLTVVGGVHEEPAAPSQDFADETPLGNGSPAGARLLATQMAVSGSTRAEIEARLRNGFKIADTRAILDAILGPEN